MSRLNPVLAVVLSFAGAAAQEPAADFLLKPATDAVRVLTWNVYRDSVFPPEGQAVDVTQATRPAQFARVLRAVQPDVLCLQQITVSAQRSAALLDQILPQADGQMWQAHAAGDTVIVSRFRLGARGEGRVEDSPPGRGHGIAVVEAPATDLYVICAHFQSSAEREAMTLRQRHADLIARTIREAKIDGGARPSLRPGMPFIILGDFNAIPDASAFIDVMTSGDGARRAGDDGATGPDWDGSSLTDARPQHNRAHSDVYTWRNDLERFPPGMLDRMLYSDSVISSVNQFVLDTTEMSYEELVGHGLRSIDVMLDPQAGIHDHFPLVIDLRMRQRQ